MRLIDALEILKQPISPDAARLKIFLACGFTPLHLQTFLAAHLRQRLPQYRIEVNTGLFGDLAGSIEQVRPEASDVLAVIIEWQDIDPRLGVRSLGGWQVQNLADILKSAENALSRLQHAIAKTSAACPVSVCMPTLPLPPLFTNATSQAGNHEVQLRSMIASFAAAIAAQPLVRVLSAQYLDESSPPNARLDLKSEIIAGFPYQLPHASALAEQLAALIHSPAPKKGLITDLDDTLWAGILGEVGVEGISWNLDQHTHIHGLYQQFLASLSSAGILIGIASKNDPALVERAFERSDLILRKEQVFPVEAHWSSKSESVRRILKTWNIGPEAVIFVDDSPMELAEVQAAFPEIERVLFKASDYAAVWSLLNHLRDQFGKNSVSQEDLLRLQSIRAASAFRESQAAHSGGNASDDFLQDAAATIHVSIDKQARDERALELINKTNQFNLNGKRLTDAAWIAYLNDPAAFLMTVSYDDKYGPLGKIAALLGKARGAELQIDFWVMSCRAFSRRVEHQSLRLLFEAFDVQEIRFDYQLTPRNGPLQEFFNSLLGETPRSDVRVRKHVFLDKCPALFHQVNLKEPVNA